MAEKKSLYPQEFGSDTIERLLPHRYPILMVDKVVEWEAAKRIVAYKMVSSNEPHFPGHFPGQPLMPGVLIIEALAQAGGLLVMLSADSMSDEVPKMYLAGIDNARFKRPVVPGDSLRLEITVAQRRGNFSRLLGEAQVDGELAAKAELLTVVDS